MAQESQVTLLISLLSSYDACITYQPLRTEVAFASLIEIPETVRVYEIPPRAGEDPHSEAQNAKAFAQGGSVCVLIPGRAFDASGTRHGQGGGWYDRFLGEVPRDWLRIGFCFSDQFSATPLKREHWDQTMDIVVVVDRVTGNGTLYSAEGIPKHD